MLIEGAEWKEWGSKSMNNWLELIPIWKKLGFQKVWFLIFDFLPNSNKEFSLFNIFVVRVINHNGISRCTMSIFIFLICAFRFTFWVAEWLELYLTVLWYLFLLISQLTSVIQIHLHFESYITLFIGILCNCSWPALELCHLQP